MANPKEMSVEEVREGIDKARKCHEDAMEIAIVTYMGELLRFLEKEDLHVGYLMDDEPHTASGHIPLNGGLGIPYEFSVKLSKPALVEDLFNKQKEKFPGVPIKHLKVN